MTQLHDPPVMPTELRGAVTRALDEWWASAGQDVPVAARELAAAIAEDRLHLAYQPIVDLSDGRMVAMGARGRRDPAPVAELGDASRIIAVAETSGLIRALGVWVLSTACVQAGIWREEVGHLQMHVNASAMELRDATYLEHVTGVLRATGLSPEALVIEITESAALEREGDAQHVLIGLTARGVEIALDDFGTGFASLDLLAATPARTLKLDRSFVAALGDESEETRGRAMIVQAAIGLGRSLGLELVGEGVETATQARTLYSWGCQLGQGYLYGRPVRAEDVDLRLARPIPAPGSRSVTQRRALSSEAVDLGLGLATVRMALDADGGRMRTDALTSATVIASALGTDRERAEAATLLAAIGDVQKHLRRLGAERDTEGPAARELIEELSVAPVIRRDTSAGAIARTAWALAMARASGEPEPPAALLAAHPDPAVDTELRARVRTWWQTPAEATVPKDRLLALERRLHARDDANQRLRSLVGLANAIGSSGSLADVLEVTAEEARRVLGAASLSIARIEHTERLFRILVNVGDLADVEERRPTDELYPFADLPTSSQRVQDRMIHFESWNPGEPDPSEGRLLEMLGKGGSAMVPITVEDEVWGAMYATTQHSSPAFTFADGPFLSAVASFVGVAIARAEDVGRLAQLVHEDPLTRVANRRRLDEHVTRLLETVADGHVALAMMDVTGLKQINDEFGHTVGDRMLMTVAEALNRASLAQRDGLAARIGSDEFCLVLRGTVSDASELVEEVLARLADEPPPQPRLSVGVVQSRDRDHTLGDLLRRADSAQFTAKRRGLSIVTEDELSDLAEPPADGGTGRRRRQRSEPIPPGTEGTLRAWKQIVDDSARDVPGALEMIGEVAMHMLDLNRWSLSSSPAGAATIALQRINLRRNRRTDGPHRDAREDVYDLAEYPQTAAVLDAGTGFVVDTSDPDADPAETAWLEQAGLTGDIAVAATDPSTDTRWLLEMYLDDRSVPAVAGAELVDALVRHTLGRPAFEPRDG